MAMAMAELASTVLVKSNLQAVLLLGDNRSSESKVFFASLARKTMDVVVTLPTILVEGRIHPKMANDLQAYLTLEAGAFFPVTAAKSAGRLDPATCRKARRSWSTGTRSRPFRSVRVHSPAGRRLHTTPKMRHNRCNRKQVRETFSRTTTRTRRPAVSGRRGQPKLSASAPVRLCARLRSSNPWWEPYHASVCHRPVCCLVELCRNAGRTSDRRSRKKNSRLSSL